MATRQEIERECGHLAQVGEVTPESPDSCADCVALGDEWMHLRECQTCGHVGCCDSSKNKHATAHRRISGHPLVRSFEPGEDWWYCYEDDLLFEVDGVGPLRTA